jgi:hypothetical protein
MGAGAWRIHDVTRPMPPELKTITLQVIIARRTLHRVLGVMVKEGALRRQAKSTHDPFAVFSLSG